ncbi:hypothetical protein CDV36_003455 [Fusarium kuroshium]|uniref:Gfd2/YDR514C-like C-terminal domain-containing protein n=1 Tax=Fusarium kuroshium TaxID=2010991 RepID=A0A3M2SI62_9HYPO|nr:hypothetical protein CDV36_003455 [Fusarium kuroshium]
MSPPSRPRNWWRLGISNNGLGVLQRALGLSESDQPSPIIVAVDFEMTNNLKRGFLESQDSQLGIATFDTNVLSQPDEDEEDLITTENYITGSESYIKKASDRFAFGESTTIQPLKAELVHRIDTALPKDRSIILVGHAVENELDIFHALGYTLTHPNMEVVNTVQVSNEVYGPWQCKLRSLLQWLGCPFNRLHSAGNDANFTLKAALLLATYGCVDRNEAVVARLRQIVSSSVPEPDPCYRVPDQYCDIINGRKRERRKKKKNSKKQKSKSLSLEQRDEIRAQRAAWRIEAERLRLY